MTLKNLFAGVVFAGICCFCSCSSDRVEEYHGDGYTKSHVTDDSAVSHGYDGFVVRGADVSWLSEMENEGYKFYYANGKEGSAIDILKSSGVNTFRFRVWVNPSEGWNALPDVIGKAMRATEAGARIMIDFHYSDSWADPANQSVPAAWKGYNIDQLCDAVSSHTKSVLTELKQRGINVDWVQVGNETSNGMLWPYGKADINPGGYARLNNAGYDAVKSIFPDAQVIVHLANAHKLADAEWLLGLLAENEGKWDIIGLSLYPEPDNFSTMVEVTGHNITVLTQKYQCKAMLCEVGMGEVYEMQCYEFLRKCFELETIVPDNSYVGTLYWEPQCYGNFKGYKKGAFTQSGRPGKGLEAYGIGSSVPVITVD